MSNDLTRFSDRIVTLEREVARLKGTPSLAHSSIENGAIDAYDLDGTQTMRIGKQHDGTSTNAILNGPIPPVPTGLTVEPTIAGCAPTWDGTFVDDAVAPMDFATVEVHYSAESADFTPELVGPESTTLAGVIGSARGGTILVGPLPYIEHWFKLVSRSLGGKFSAPSEAVSATPTEIKILDLDQEFLDQITAINEAASTAQETADGKNQTYYSSSDPSGPAVEGDTWYKISGTLIIGHWSYTGGTWTGLALSNSTIANLDAGKISTGFLNVALLIQAGAIQASKIASYSITADKIAVNTIQAYNMAANSVTANTLQANAVDGKTINGVYINGNLFKSSAGSQRVEMGNTGYNDPVDEVRMFNNYTVVSMRHITGYAGMLYFSLQGADGNYGALNFQGTTDGYVSIGRGLNIGPRLKFAYAGIHARNSDDSGYVRMLASSFDVSSAAKFKTDIEPLSDVETAPLLKKAGLHKWKWNAKNTDLQHLKDAPPEDFVAADRSLRGEENPDLAQRLKKFKAGKAAKAAAIAAAEIEADKDIYGLIADDLPDFLQEEDGYSVSAVVGFLWQALKESNARIEALEARIPGTGAPTRTRPGTIEP